MAFYLALGIYSPIVKCEESRSENSNKTKNASEARWWTNKNEWTKVGSGMGFTHYIGNIFEQKENGITYVCCSIKHETSNPYAIGALRNKKGMEHLDYLITLYAFHLPTNTYCTAGKVFIDSTGDIISGEKWQGKWYPVKDDDIAEKVINWLKRNHHSETAKKS